MVVTGVAAESVTLTTKGKSVSAATGLTVPVICPVVESSAKPPGSDPELTVQVSGAIPPDAERRKL